ncbi:MAG: hypothetical protein HOV80_09665 [Polyangiaceae bacterium]|nr:hypothetical protein [Polyangiaceae bacterium]
MTIGPPSLEATITCGGQPLQLSCPGPTTTLSTTIGSDGTTTAYCVASDMVTSINVAIPDPAVGNLRDLAKKYFVAINCPNGDVQSISELGGGYVIVESIDPGVQVKGSFASDAGDVSGTFLAVASQQ